MCFGKVAAAAAAASSGYSCSRDCSRGRNRGCSRVCLLIIYNNIDCSRGCIRRRGSNLDQYVTCDLINEYTFKRLYFAAESVYQLITAQLHNCSRGCSRGCSCGGNRSKTHRTRSSILLINNIQTRIIIIIIIIIINMQPRLQPRLQPLLRSRLRLQPRLQPQMCFQPAPKKFITYMAPCEKRYCV